MRGLMRLWLTRTLYDCCGDASSFLLSHHFVPLKSIIEGMVHPKMTVIIHSLSCHSKPVWLFCFYGEVWLQSSFELGCLGSASSSLSYVIYSDLPLLSIIFQCLVWSIVVMIKKKETVCKFGAGAENKRTLRVFTRAKVSHKLTWCMWCIT